ncbi:hypothetical protein [Streptomyces sp. NPDC001970]
MTNDDITEAQLVCNELHAALEAAGITLPSLTIDVASAVPLVALGRCNVATARRLAEVVRGGDR